MKKAFYIFAVLTVCFLSADIGNSAPVQWVENGHFYEAVPGAVTVPSTGFTSWAEARDQAASMYYLGMQGHLATLTSQTEDEWVWSNLGINLERFLLGGYQDPNYAETSPTDNWQWVTGETWSWTYWDGTEPNNGNGGYEEDALAFTNAYGKWNDLPYSKASFNDFNWYIYGYVVEYEPSTSPVSEPTTMLLLGLGLMGLAGARRKYKR